MTAEVMSNETEVVMAEADARRLTERIKLTYTTAQEAVDKLVSLIQEARDGGAHEALGYKSWTDYCRAEFDVQLKLPATDRRELVVQLSEMGMSSRAIAPIVGADHTTVYRDTQPGVANATPGAVIGTDGKTYQRPEKKARRAPLPDAFRRHSMTLRSTARSIRNLTEDDRFKRGRADLVELIEADLTQAIKQAQEALALLKEK